jgi:hypothetical protein
VRKDVFEKGSWKAWEKEASEKVTREKGRFRKREIQKKGDSEKGSLI